MMLLSLFGPSIDHITYLAPNLISCCPSLLPTSPLSYRFDDDLDQWGRPRKQIITLPTEALPDNVDTSNIPDLEQIQSLEDALKALRTAADRKEDGSKKTDGDGPAAGAGRR
jgi:hypothetical protein